jgi:hypothetical protein
VALDLTRSSIQIVCPNSLKFWREPQRCEPIARWLSNRSVHEAVSAAERKE